MNHEKEQPLTKEKTKPTSNDFNNKLTKIKNISIALIITGILSVVFFIAFFTMIAILAYQQPSFGPDQQPELIIFISIFIFLFAVISIINLALGVVFLIKIITYETLNTNSSFFLVFIFSIIGFIVPFFGFVALILALIKIKELNDFNLNN